MAPVEGAAVLAALAAGEPLEPVANQLLLTLAVPFAVAV